MKVINCTCYKNQRCEECEELKDKIIQFELDGDDEDGVVGWVCKDCLKKALEMLGEDL